MSPRGGPGASPATRLAADAHGARSVDAVAAPARAVRPVPVGGLTVGRAGDPAEHTADALAETALARLRRAGTLGVHRGQDDGADGGRRPHRHDVACGHLRRIWGPAGVSGAPVGPAGGPLDAPTSARIEALRGGGAALPGSVRRRMETAFGTSLDHVRVHDGPEAAHLSAAVSAEAFTTGRDIFFGAGRFDPTDPVGEHILAHEIAHVVNEPARPLIQRYFPPPPLALGPTGFRALVTKTGGAQPHVPVLKDGWSVDKETVPATEIHNNGGHAQGVKTNRLTALLTPGHAKILAGGPTAQGYDPIGWTWIVTNEVRSARRQRISHWVRFHLLNATLGGKGRKTTHLIPADQSANGKWRTQIEAQMKAALATMPVWYDVQITYYTQAEAPGTYAPAGPLAPDFRPNIELFPKVIHADWKTWDTSKQQWQDRPPCTVRSGQPAAPGQREDELRGAQNLRQLASVYQIDVDILDLLARAAGPFTRYAQVRHLLENWAASFASAGQYEARMDRIASSEPYLRSALTGTGNRKLKFNNAFVPDDATPEAAFYVSPARVKEPADLSVFDSVTQWIRSGYVYASNSFRSVPSAREFFHHYVRTPYGNVTLGQLQADWDQFVIANDALPPMVRTDFAPEGREILTLVVPDLTASVPAALRREYEKRVGHGVAVDSLCDLVEGRIPQFVESNLQQLRFTVYQDESASMGVVRTDPTVAGWLKEMDFRVEWVAFLRGKGLLAQCPHDVLAASITDLATVAHAQAWYQSTKQQATVPVPVTVPAQQPMPSTQPTFGGLGSSSSPFGGFGSSSSFGQPGQTSPFGGSSTSFGQPTPSSPFGGSTFGGPMSSPSFGQPSQTSPFGGSDLSSSGTSQPHHGGPPPRRTNPGPGGGPVRGGSGRTPARLGPPWGSGRDQPYPEPSIGSPGGATHPTNRAVIRGIEEACDLERLRGTKIDDTRVNNVLRQWRTSRYVGKGDVQVDVKRAMDYILKHVGT